MSIKAWGLLPPDEQKANDDRQIDMLVAEVARLGGELGYMTRERDRLAAERDAARADAQRLAEALRHAEEWLDDEGCDCGTVDCTCWRVATWSARDEPSTCALCECRAALAAHKEQP